MALFPAISGFPFGNFKPRTHNFDGNTWDGGAHSILDENVPTFLPPKAVIHQGLPQGIYGDPDFDKCSQLLLPVQNLLSTLNYEPSRESPCASQVKPQPQIQSDSTTLPYHSNTGPLAICPACAPCTSAP